jgi:hypothetical protein
MWRGCLDSIDTNANGQTLKTLFPQERLDQLRIQAEQNALSSAHTQNKLQTSILTSHNESDIENESRDSISHRYTENESARKQDDTDALNQNMNRNGDESTDRNEDNDLRLA